MGDASAGITVEATVIWPRWGLVLSLITCVMLSDVKLQYLTSVTWLGTA